MPGALDVRAGERGDEFVPLKVLPDPETGEDVEVGVYVRPGDIVQSQNVFLRLEKLDPTQTTVLPKDLEEDLEELIKGVVDRFSEGFATDGPRSLQPDDTFETDDGEVRVLDWFADYVVGKRTLRPLDGSWGMKIVMASLGLAQALEGNSSGPPGGSGATDPDGQTGSPRSTAKGGRSTGRSRKKKGN